MRFLFLSVLLLAALTLSIAPAQDKKDKDKKDDKAPAGAVFEVYKDKSDEFGFRLTSGDDKLAMSVKGYKTKDEVDKIIDHIKKEAAKAKVVDDTKSK